MKVLHDIFKNASTGERVLAPVLMEKFREVTGKCAMVQSSYSRNYSVERPEFRTWAIENGWAVVGSRLCTY